MGSELRDLRKHTDELSRGAVESQVTHGEPCLSLAKCNNPVTDLDSSQQVLRSRGKRAGPSRWDYISRLMGDCGLSLEFSLQDRVEFIMSSLRCL